VVWALGPPLPNCEKGEPGSSRAERGDSNLCPQDAQKLACLQLCAGLHVWRQRNAVHPVATVESPHVPSSSLIHVFIH
jgi:hypothetical protein